MRAFRLGLLLLLLPILLLRCGSNHQEPAENMAITKAEADFRKFFEICDDKGFASGAHETVPIYKPFIVREVRGKLNWYGGWPEGILPLFEIRRTGKGTKILGVHTDAEGNFLMENIPAGRYCFQASCGQPWIAFLGIIIVDKKADPKNQIILEMEPD